MIGDSFTTIRSNHNCLAIATTESITEFLPSLYPIIIRCQDSLKTFRLWCDTTKWSLVLKGGLSQTFVF